MAAATASNLYEERGKILVASSQAAFRKRLMERLRPVALNSVEALGGADALLQLATSPFKTLLLDPLIEDLDVSELVETVHARYPETRVMVVEKTETAEQLAIDFLERETEAGDALAETQSEIATVEEIPEQIAEPAECVVEELSALPELPVLPAMKSCVALPGMIGTSPQMQRLYRLARLVAPRDTAVLIVGPTGTGKELVARGIHDVSRRSRGPFIVVNCAAIPESLLEAELFGFTRGAFTGAVQARLGRIHAAHGGTLLLDEIGELPLSMQAKLLRFVQEGEVQRLGSADLFRVDARLIAATNVDLTQRVREKQFREDLYYRLAVFPLDLPPLRTRSEDILQLATHFLDAFCRQSSTARKTFSAASIGLLRQHAWPGNVRELQHWIERAVVLAEANEKIEPEHLTMGDSMLPLLT
jgi:DNA-binding NtrC family response regulator